MRRAVVTGADGFLGRHLVQVLQQHGVTVTTLTRRPKPTTCNVAMGDAPWCPVCLAKVIEIAEPDAIFHLIGSAVGSQAELEKLNVEAARAVMSALRYAQAKPLLVLCGSAAEYGAAVVDGVPVCETAICAPLSAYGVSKLAQTNAALAFAEATNTAVLVARIFNPIGPGMPSYLALGGFAQQIAMLPASPGILRTGNLAVYRDFIDVEHVVDALRILAENPAARGVVNVCSGLATELSKLVEILIDVSGKHVILETAADRLRPGELRTVIGSTTRLAALGAMPPSTDYADVVGRIWRNARTQWVAAE